MRDYRDADVRPAAEAQQSALVAAQFVKRGEGFVVFLQDAAGIRKEQHPRFGPPQLPPPPPVPLLARPLLRVPDLPQNPGGAQGPVLGPPAAVPELADAD